MREKLLVPNFSFVLLSMQAPEFGINMAVINRRSAGQRLNS